jgi:glycosyltransferase involved in cell wall biosynthesis
VKNISDLSITFLAGTLGSGGAERQLFYILKTLRLMDCKANLITLKKGQYWEESIRKLGVPIFFAGASENRLWRLLTIISIVYSNNPMIIQSQHFYTNIYSAIAGYLCKKPHIGAIRSNGNYEVKITGTFFGKLCLHMPKYLAANSLAGKRYAEGVRKNYERLKFLPNVIDTEIFKPARKAKTSNCINILLVSNLWLPEKRVELFIKAISLLKDKVKIPISAKIVGEGPLKNKLLSIGSEYGVYPGIIDFLGSQNNIEQIYRLSDILVLTSDREGTPNVVMEAMATGLPVVGTNVGGVSEILQDGSTGFLVEAGNINDIVEKMAILIDDYSLRQQMGYLGRNYILENHSLEKFPHILTNFYSSIN